MIDIGNQLAARKGLDVCAIGQVPRDGEARAAMGAGREGVKVKSTGGGYVLFLKRQLSAFDLSQSNQFVIPLLSLRGQ